MIKVDLEFGKMVTSLAGNRFGKTEFEKQVKEVEYNECYEINFPDRIKNIATSFIQGFFQGFVECFGIVGIKEKVEINSTILNLKQLIIECLI